MRKSGSAVSCRSTEQWRCPRAGGPAWALVVSFAYARCVVSEAVPVALWDRQSTVEVRGEQMQLEDLTLGVSRAPWNSVARHLLSRAGYDPSHGYKKTMAAILGEPLDATKVTALAGVLKEHLVAGEKLIQLIGVSPTERAAVERWVKGKRATSDVLTAVFPGAAAEKVIAPLQSSAPVSAGYVGLEEGNAALFTSVRSFVKSEELPQSSLKAAAAAGFERVVGYRKVHVHCYDAIWVPDAPSDYIVFAVDLPRGVPKLAFADPAQKFLEVTLRRVLKRQLKFANFWHVIDGLYSGTSGKLVDYGFSAGGHSVNHHKARRRTSVCLRKAVYDAAGAAAVKANGSSLELFKVAMQWSHKHQDGTVTEPEVIIPGVAADLNKPMANVDHCIVRNCLSTSDLAMVVRKLHPLITAWV